MENTVNNIEETVVTAEAAKKAEAAEEKAFILPETDDPECISFCNQHNINYCLKKIDEIGNESESIITAVKAIASLDVVMTPVGSSAEEQAKAIADIIRKREETNQKKIDFYRDMIDRFLPPKKDEKAENERRRQYLDWITDTLIGSDMPYEITDLVKLYREFQ